MKSFGNQRDVFYHVIVAVGRATLFHLELLRLALDSRFTFRHRWDFPFNFLTWSEIFLSISLTSYRLLCGARNIGGCIHRRVSPT